MRAAEKCHVEWVEGEAVVLNQQTEQLHYLNGPAALVYAMILEEGYGPALDKLRTDYGNDPDFERELPALLDDMKERGLLVDD